MFKRQSVFFSWLLSYVLILFVPLIFGIAVYIRAEKTVEYEVSHANRVMLEYSQQSMDNGHKDINRLINQIEMNKRFRQLIAINRKEPNGNYYSDIVIQALEDFKYYRISSGFVSDYFIYLGNIDKIVTGNALIDQDIYYKTKVENGSNGRIPEYEWTRLLQGSYSGKYMALPSNKPEDADFVPKIIYSIKLPLNQNADSKAILVILLDSKKIKNMAGNIRKANNGWSVILDKDNRLLLSTAELTRIPPEISYDRLDNEEKAVYLTVNGKKSVVTFIKSKEVEWKYISIIPYDIFWGKVDSIRLITFICTVSGILSGILISYILARKNYVPVVRLLATLRNKSRNIGKKGVNEYKLIQEAISDTINENLSVHKKLRQQNNVLRLLFLRKLVQGRVSDPGFIEASIPLYDLRFDTDSFAVAVFYIKASDMDSESGRPQETAGDGLELARFIITNVVEELVSKEDNGYMTEVEDMSVCLINFKNPEGGMQRLLFVLKEAYDFIGTRYGIKSAIAVSGVHSAYAGIAEAYHEALDTMEYQIAMGAEEILCHSDIKEFGGRYNYSIKTENRLISCIKTGDFENSRMLLDEIFDSSFNKNRLSNKLVKFTMFSLANTIMKAVIETSGICGEEFIDVPDIEERLLKCERIQDLKAQMTTIMEKICICINDSKKGRKKTLVEDIAAFIESNYSDANLSVGLIAEKFGLTPAYLSKLFKEQRSEGVCDYICRIRMEKAKLLLKSQDLNIKEVAELVGYFSSNIFIRTFKRYEGITPGAFKGME